MELSFPIPRQTEILGPFSVKWFDFVSRFRYRQKQKGERKCSFMLHYGDTVIKEMQESHHMSWEELRKFSSLVDSLEHECLFQISLSFLRYLFFNHNRKTGLCIEDFYKELKLLSEYCSFDSVASDNLIKDQVINSIQDENVRKVFLSGVTLTARDVVDICTKIENRDDPVSQELVLAYLKDQQQYSFQFSTDEIENSGNSSFQEPQPAVINESSKFSTVIIPDHEYTTNIGDSTPISDEMEYETYSVEIFEPAYSLSDLTSNILDKTAPLEATDGASPTFVQPAPLKAHDPGYQPESSILSIFPPAPPPPSARPCVSIYHKKKSKRNLTLTTQKVTKQLEASTDGDVCKSENFSEVAHLTSTTATSTIPSLQIPNSSLSDIGGANNFETIFISISNPNIMTQSDTDCNVETPFPDNTITVTVADDVNDILEPNFCSQQEVELKVSHSHYPSTSLPVDPFVAVDVDEIPQWCCSKQKAYLKTSQIKECTGQNVDVYSCNFCVYGCTGKDDMEDHVMQQHKSLRCFVCTICNCKFPHEDQFRSHVRTQHLKLEDHRCQTCDLVFDSQEKLFLHTDSHAEQVSCRVCGAMFSTEKFLSNHMASMHPDVNRWSCQICTSTFLTRKSLSDHLCKVHKDRDRSKEKERARRFTCKQCGINFSDKKSSELHRKNFHWKPRAKQFQCDICPYVCATRHKLTTHHRIHTGEKPYICEVCGKGFAQLSALTRHTRYHTGEKPYKCQYCDRAYFTSTGRLAHERKHRNERPYVCEQCGKTFRNSSELKMHIETHNELRTKRFQCHCGAAFDTRRNLKRHAVRHSGVKAYKCEICGASFTHPENVTGHQKSGACSNRMLKLMKLKE